MGRQAMHSGGRVSTGRLRRGAGAILLLAILAGCGDDAPPEPTTTPPTVAWERGSATVESAAGTHQIDVEIAETDEQRAYGLMNRESLPADAGMIFVYDGDQPPEAGFWMFNTRIPLDIAFLDGAGQILNIRRMEPCASPYPQWCPNYEAGVSYRAALEMNAGWFQENGVTVGDRVVLSR